MTYMTTAPEASQSRLRAMACRTCGRRMTAKERAEVAADLLAHGMRVADVVGWLCHEH